MKNQWNSVSSASILHCFQLKIRPTRLIISIFCIMIILFIIYSLLLTDRHIKHVHQFLIDNRTGIFHSQTSVKHIYSFNQNKKLVPEFIERILNKAQSPSTCLIIIRTVDGAIGNRMFLFASAYGLARLHQCNLYVAPWIIRDLRSIFLIHLNETPVHLITDDRIVNQTGIVQRYSSCTLFNDLVRIPLKENLTKYEMIGFYQAFGYFVKYKDEISYLFQFNQAAIRSVIPLVDQLLHAIWNISLNLGNYTKDTVTHQYLKNLLIDPPSPLIPVTWIAIHIRRGDFLTFFKIDTSIEYLNFAMEHYRRKYINVRFLIASDDKPYAKKYLGNQTDIFITPDGFFSGDDLAALALCDHTIVTAGSYGWWAAWLAGGDVIHDLNYPVAFQNCLRDHYFPPWFVFPQNTSSQTNS